MGLTKRLFKVTAQEPEWVSDWIGAELVERVDVIQVQVEMLDAERDRLETNLAERVELIEAQVELLDAERDRLETELVKSVDVIEAQVELLDAERNRLEAELADRVRVIEAQAEMLDAERSRLEADHSIELSRRPHVVRVPQAEKAEPVNLADEAQTDWWSLALLACAVLALCVLTAAILFTGWQLLTW
jgi:chromosome segregation ATPase